MSEAASADGPSNAKRRGEPNALPRHAANAAAFFINDPPTGPASAADLAKPTPNFD